MLAAGDFESTVTRPRPPPLPPPTVRAEVRGTAVVAPQRRWLEEVASARRCRRKQSGSHHSLNFWGGERSSKNDLNRECWHLEMKGLHKARAASTAALK